MGVGRIARRTFLGLGVAAVGGLAVGYYFYRRPFANPLEAGLGEGEATFNPYVKIGTDGAVTIIAPRAEMGQGTQTTLAALVAEELDVALAEVRVEHGPPSPAYYNAAIVAEGGPFAAFDESFTAEAARGAMRIVSKFLAIQATGGSSAMVDGFEKMRLAGAAARQLLVQAAARRWGVEAASLRTEAGRVINAEGAALLYGELAMEAAAMEPPAEVALKDRTEWRLLGRPQERVDALAKVTGAPIFGIDVDLPGMLHATVRMSPRFGAKALSANEAPVLAVKGVRRVVPIETITGAGFGIIAGNTWAAFQGAEALEVTWGEAPYPADDAGIGALYEAALARAPDFVMLDEGDVDEALAGAPADELLEARYDVPFLAHACMEPMNATALFQGERLTIWTGTQAPGLVQEACAGLLGIDTEAVTVHVTHLGGGFGRRFEVDYPLYAAAIARAEPGRPVKVTWTREEDMRHDAYRPRLAARLRARIKAGNGPEALDIQVAGPSIIASVLGRTYPWLPASGPDKTLLDGSIGQPITLPAHRVGASVVELGIPVGFWRSVGNSANAFFHECFLDELAAKAELDPIGLRLGLMTEPEHAPARGVLEKLREVSGWGEPLASGRGRGVAFCLSFGSWVGEVVEVDASSGAARIAKVWCVADAGLVLDPRIFRAQMVSGIVYGLSAALGQAITFRDGAVVEGNFDTFDAMRMHQCPAIEVHLLESAPRMGGAGEPGTPPAAPALANAIFAATGRRLRAMPFGAAMAFA
ncbi:MAG TPA: molybdopterin cofactor-binding domain-containing protein [Paracoccaceae bacterium]|nr:molybdopterin cofactor-binding domain-containing protein [Paracoccaceae bacterium]